MAVDDISKNPAGVTTRRTIVKTGAKLAYAAPLIAGTMKLKSGSAAALSGECLTVGRIGCVTSDTKCGASVAGPGLCVCLATTEGGITCTNVNFLCDADGVVPCGASSECPDTWSCAFDPCCNGGNPVCLPPCGTDPQS